MDNIYMVSMVAVLRLVIGVILFRLALKPMYRNLHWLAAVFYLHFLMLFFRDRFPIPLVLMIAIHSCLALFTHTTFYKHRRSPVVLVIGGLILGGTAPFFFVPARGLILWGITTLHVMCAINWFWHAFAAWQVSRKLRNDKSIEDWVKGRYALVVSYAVLMGALFLLPVWRSPIPFVSYIGPVGMMTGFVLQYLAWGMPTALRNYLNRNYQPPMAGQVDLDVSEEDILRELEKARS